MTNLEIHTRTGKPFRLDKFAREVRPDDTLSLRLILREWAKEKKRNPSDLVIKAWDQSRGWRPTTMD